MDKPKVGPKDFFLWAGAVVSLYGSVFALLALLFHYIDYAYPDPLAYNYAEPYSSGMRFAMASLIVLVPVAIVLMRLIRNDIAREAMKADMWIRRWALVLTVFIAGATVVGDLIALVNGFLGGDLTTPFVLKVLVVLLVVGAAFLHFLADLRGYWIANPKRAQSVGIGAGVAVIATIVAGFFIMGSPATVRLLRFDTQKVNDLQNIQWQVVNYWQQKGELPVSLFDLKDPISGTIIPTDPQSGVDYGYRITKPPRSFELCAEFNVESRDFTMNVNKGDSVHLGAAESENWQHAAGQTCFERTVDPDRYPIFEKPVPTRVF